MPLNAYAYGNTLEELNVSLADLGCVMLDVENLQLGESIPPAALYRSEHPDRPWIDGIVADTAAHLTLLYGLLQSARTWKAQVDAVLAGWQPGKIVVDRVSSFPSAYPDENYSCVIAKVRMTTELHEAHARLSFLPHINTQLHYTPHVTIAYVHPEYERDVVTALEPLLTGKTLTATGLNYGLN